MGCIFRPEALSWEDIDGGRGEMTMEAIRNFISEYCYPDEYADYGDDEELPNELVFFAEMWELSLIHISEPPSLLRSYYE